MKQIITIARHEVQYYSTNLCSHGDVGDYELFPAEKLEINIKEIVERYRDRTTIRWSSLAAQFSLKDVKVSLYAEGRVILEGIKPDSHEEAFRFLKEILSGKTIPA